MLENFDLMTVLVNTISAILLGFVVAFFYMYKSEYNKPFVVTLVILPAIVGTVISIVNGNVGTGIAVMGAFSLVRFRSIPGTSKEIAFIFFSMAIGLATGMGYIPYAAVFTLIVGFVSSVLFLSPFGEKKTSPRLLKITLPENLDYSGLFDDLFSLYTQSSTLKRVKTTNMGSLFQLQYDIILKDETLEKEFIDKIRCRNGNLDIVCAHTSASTDVL